MNVEGLMECMKECGMCLDMSYLEVTSLLIRTQMNTRIFEVDVMAGVYYTKGIYRICDTDRDTVIRCLKSIIKYLGGLCANDAYPIFDALLAGETARVIQ